MSTGDPQPRTTRRTHPTSTDQQRPVVRPPRGRETSFPGAAALDAFVFRHGAQYDSYLCTEPDRSLFWSHGNRGVLSFKQVGRHLLVAGGLIAPDEAKSALLEEFLAHAARLKLRPVFFCILEADLPYFREAGLRITKFGEDAIVDLPDLTYEGKQFEWVRRQANYCRRHGVVVSETGPGFLTPDVWQATLAELLEISRDSLQEKPQREELRFFDGHVGEHGLGRRRLFVARSDNGHGRIEGFVVCNPMQGGRMWSTEIYRHRSDAVRGVVASVIHHLTLALKEEGVEAVNLCLIPGRNCATPLPGDNPLVRRGLVVGQKYFSALFDLRGIDHFKSRFRPRYENRYLCTPPEPSLGAFIATLRVFGVFNVDLRKTGRLLWQRVRKFSARRSLPKPK